jgi:protein-L-isoaspartate O-methyltransferase
VVNEGASEDIVNGCATEEVIHDLLHDLADEGALVMPVAPSVGEVVV